MKKAGIVTFYNESEIVLYFVVKLFEEFLVYPTVILNVETRIIMFY